jgi:CysZ protein
MKTVLRGFGYPFRAFGAIGSGQGLWVFVLVPILINIVVGALLYAWLFAAGTEWIDSQIMSLPEWLQFAAWFLRGLLAILLFVVVGYLLVRFGVIFGSPFYGQLSERLETQLTGSAPPASPLTFAGVTYDIWRAILYELKKLCLALAIGLPLLLIGLIPVVGQFIAIAGQIALGAWITALDFLDSPLERRRLRFREKLGTIRRGLPTTGAFGLICFGLVSIPLINLVAIPLCVAAGTILFCEQHLAETKSTNL